VITKLNLDDKWRADSVKAAKTTVVKSEAE